MSQWDDLDMDSKVTKILDVQSHKPNHHFGRPFVTPYQIALKFEKLYPNETQIIGKPTGGKGVGQYDSLAQYIAGQLSKRIKSGKISNIEGRFLHRSDLKSLKYQDGVEIEASSGKSYDLSVYRLME